MPDFDTIIIGSGAGGLTAAVALANAGQRVLVLEQHYLPGGWCHSFPLGGHHFSPGVHYIGELGPGGRLRSIYEGLGVAGDIVFAELNPDGLDHVRIGKERFDIPKGVDRLKAGLVERFPHEQKGILAVIETVERLNKEVGHLTRLYQPTDLLRLAREAPTLLRWGLRSWKSLLDRHVQDPLARAVLSIQAGDHGLPPSKAPVAMQAAVMSHYFDGGWYPIGGGRAIPRAFLRALKRAGGEIRLESPVAKVLLESGPGGERQAVGVRLADGQEISARHVISNADPGMTLGRLVGREHLSRRERWQLDRSRWSVAALSLFAAARIDTDALGLDSGNLWYLEEPDLERPYTLPARALEESGPLPGAFLTLTTLKDRTRRKSPGDPHTLEAFAFVPWDSVSAWAGSKMDARPASYQRFKAHLQQRMVETVGRLVPGIEDALSFQELGTPLTNLHYVAATEGNLYGTEKSRFQIGPFAFPVRTRIAGLWMCGASTLGHGVMGATFSGLVAAAGLLGVRPSELLRKQGPPLRTVSCDDLSSWPEDLRARAHLDEGPEPGAVSSVSPPPP